MCFVNDQHRMRWYDSINQSKLPQPNI